MFGRRTVLHSTIEEIAYSILLLLLFHILVVGWCIYKLPWLHPPPPPPPAPSRRFSWLLMCVFLCFVGLFSAERIDSYYWIIEEKGRRWKINVPCLMTVLRGSSWRLELFVAPSHTPGEDGPANFLHSSSSSSSFLSGKKIKKLSFWTKKKEKRTNWPPDTRIFPPWPLSERDRRRRRRRGSSSSSNSNSSWHGRWKVWGVYDSLRSAALASFLFIFLLLFEYR